MVCPLQPRPPVLAGKTRLAVVALLLALAGGVGGLLFAASGLYDVSAARGHWPLTRRFLTFAMERSVSRHAAGLEVPPLEEPALVYLGMGHYAGACAPCHGAPGSPRNPATLGSVPAPPFLPDMVRAWEPAELFWITKRGLKYTGMPSWPSHARDDEVWAVVAAMIRMPEMSADEYRRIVRGEPLRDLARVEEDARLIATAGPMGHDLVACARCHGLRGEGRGEGAFPALAGQSEAYLFESLRAYALGARQSAVMQSVASELDEATMRELARHFAALPPAPAAEAVAPVSSASAELRRRGQELATAGRPDRRVPPCASCHGPGSEPHALYPSLAGQPRSYLERQLRLYRAGGHSVTGLGEVMHAAARNLLEEDVQAVASYYAALPPEARLRGAGSPPTAADGAADRLRTPR